MIVKIIIGNTYKLGDELVKVVKRRKEISIGYALHKKQEVVIIENISTNFRKSITIKDFRHQAEPYQRGA